MTLVFHSSSLLIIFDDVSFYGRPHFWITFELFLLFCFKCVQFEGLSPTFRKTHEINPEKDNHFRSIKEQIGDKDQDITMESIIKVKDYYIETIPTE